MNDSQWFSIRYRCWWLFHGNSHHFSVPNHIANSLGPGFLNHPEWNILAASDLYHSPKCPKSKKITQSAVCEQPLYILIISVVAYVYNIYTYIIIYVYIYISVTIKHPLCKQLHKLYWMIDLFRKPEIWTVLPRKASTCFTVWYHLGIVIYDDACVFDCMVMYHNVSMYQKRSMYTACSTFFILWILGTL